ncbi:SDR family NAD(P)-dependent oxidoreductase [Roseiarcaceae bacterium H3SJ34-1]|uniref:SDR family NAD(P)-dependent oxidoreductase n=1 Tax=Terripilifer ovatus TaxID=3032367 RepID=UPI003AB99D55|nr:SDR family NAD(P)-dependent oxidoreductase [Roseiarcaceae bacterium H3SJ34-1]
MSKAEFEGKVALITAAAAGIGYAIAREWTRKGGTAVISDLAADALEAAASAIRSDGGRVHACLANVRHRADIEHAFAETQRFAGGLDALFNVAGTNMPKNVEEMDDDEWHAIMETNLTSVYRACHLAIPEMRRRGGGAIVNIASIAGILAENRCGAYSASKAGVVMLTKNMAMDFGRDNIRVNAICPGSTRTPRVENYWKRSPTGRSELVDLCAIKRSAEPEEIAAPAVFLASSGASYITGAILVVDGGLTAGFRVPTFDRY